MNDDKGVNCLRELVFLFRKVGGEAEAVQSTDAEAERCFNEGRGAAFREVLSFMKNQAEIFEIPLSSVGLADFDPLIDELALPAHLDTQNSDAPK